MLADEELNDEAGREDSSMEKLMLAGTMFGKFFVVLCFLLWSG